MSSCGGYDFTGLLPIIIDLLDIALTIIGLIPAPVPIAGQAGMAADAVTIVLNALIDDPVAMVLSAVALVPVAGQFSGGIKIAYKIARIVQRIFGSPIIQVGAALLGLGLLGGVYYFIYYI